MYLSLKVAVTIYLAKCGGRLQKMLQHTVS